MSAREFDPGQRAAIDVDANCVVAAGAGSGKTTVLAERYARLVLGRGLDVDQVLVLTFTRKAAAEMHQRIYRRLAEDGSQRAREQLERFDAARISTLDAFCASVARGGCHRYGVAPDFSVDEKRLQRIADEVAVETLMDRRDDPALRRLIASTGFDRTRRDFLGLVASRELSVVRPPSFRADARRQAAFVSERIARVRGQLEDLAAAISAVDGGPKPAASLLEAQKAVAKIELPPEDAAPRELAAAAAACATAFRMPTSAAKDPALVELRELAVPFKEAAAELSVLASTRGLEADAAAIAETLEDFAGRFRERKLREGLLTFRDAAELAVDILSRDLALRSHYKQRVRAIMIDEFQDDDELQKNLLFLLAERDGRLETGIPPASELAPDKLFFVGDEKQSIYRFRGADVAVFRRLAADLPPPPGGAPALSVNYRSSAGLVAFFNAFFPAVFGDPERDFDAAYRPAQARPPAAGAPAASGAAAPADAPCVELHLLETSKEEGDDDDSDSPLSPAASEAFAAARRIAEGVLAGEFAYGDVAVLFRSSSRQHEYEKALRLLGVPFVAADPRGVFLEGPANDFYALLRLVAYPDDRNAYAAVLRSPFCRVGDDALARILLDGRRDPFPDDYPPAWFAGRDDERRYLSGRAAYLAARDAADRIGAAALLSRLWHEGGYRAYLLRDRAAAAYEGHFDLVHALALDADARRLPLVAFLDELSELMGSAEKIDAGEPPAAAGSVRLMTVHKSKGLEFPVVLVADAGNRGRGPKNDAAYFRDAEFGLVPNLRYEDAARSDKPRNYFFDRALEEEKAKETAELRRLLYVAATRAERRLVVFGTRATNKDLREALEGVEGLDRAVALARSAPLDSKGERRLSSFLDLASLSLSLSEEAAARTAVLPVPALGERERRDLASALKAAAPRAAGGDPAAAFFARPPVQAPRAGKRSTSPSAMEKARAALSSSAGGTTARRPADRLPDLPVEGLLSGSGAEAAFGTLCHKAVEDSFLGRPASAPAAVRAEFARAGLDEAAVAALEAQAASLARRFLDSPVGRLARGAALRRSECSFLLPLRAAGVNEAGGAGDIVVAGTVDLLFEAEGRCVVVDFKTDKRRDPAAHAVQMACYRAAAAAFSALPAETWLHYLRSGETVLVEDVFDLPALAALAAAAPDADTGSGEEP